MNLRVVFPDKMRPFTEEPRRYNVLEGGRGGAKSHTVAEFLLLKGMETRIRVLNVREIQKSIKESVHQLFSDKIKRYRLPYDIFNNTIRCRTTGSEFYFQGLQDQTSDSLKSFEGVNWAWVEEAQSISKTSLDVLLPTIRAAGSKLIFTMNRFEEFDPVYDRFCKTTRPDVCHIYITFEDNPFCSPELKAEADVCRKEYPDDFPHIWLGMPMQQGENKILSIAKVRAAMERKVTAVGGYEIGVDVARFGDDRTTIWKRQGLKIIEYKVYTKLRTTQVAAYVFEMIGDCKEITIKVDDSGVGGGVTDELYRLNIAGASIVAVNNQQTATDPDKYPNAISEQWFEFARIIDQVELPNDMDLLKELTGRKYTFDSQARRQVESKKDFKKRYNKSPDLADGLLLCFYNVHHDLNVGVV